MPRTRGRRGLRVGVVLAGVTAAVVLLGEGRAPAAGTVCGDLPPGVTTWTAADSPVSICYHGVRVPPDGTLVVDGSLGPVTVAAVGPGGIDVHGAMRTTNSALNRVTFTGPASQGSWAGIRNYGSLTLADATVSRGIGCVVSHRGTTQVTDTTFHQCETAVWSDGGEVHVQGGTVSDGAYGAVLASEASVQGVTFRNLTGTGIRVDAWWRQGETVRIVGNTLVSVGTGGASPIKATASHLPDSELILQDNAISAGGTGGHPTIDLGGFVDVNTVTGNTGDGNGLDVMRLNQVWTPGFTWRTPTTAPGPQPLGYVIGHDLIVTEGDLVVPADAVVLARGRIELMGGRLDASAGGAVFTSVSDTTAAFSACPSAIAEAPCDPGEARWRGIYLNGVDAPDRSSRATIHGGHVRYANRCVEAKHEQPPVPLTGEEPAQVVLVDTTLAHCNSAVIAQYTPLTMTGGAIADAVDRPSVVGPFPGYGIHAVGAALTVTGTTISRTEREAVLHHGPYRSPVVLNDLTIDRANANGPAVHVAYPSTFQMKGTLITRSGTAVGAEAARISGYTGDLAGDLAGLRGGGNGYDAVALADSKTRTDLTWSPVDNSPTPHPMGYLNAGLTMSGPVTLTIPAGAAVASVDGFFLEGGAHLDAAAGGALFTGVADPANGEPRCRGERSYVVTHTSSCLDTGKWRGITANQPVGGSMTITDGTIRKAQVGFTGPGAVTLRDTVVEHGHQAIYGGGPLSITGGRISHMQESSHLPAVVTQGPTSVIGVAFSDIAGHGIAVSANRSAPQEGVTIVGNTFDRIGQIPDFGHAAISGYHLDHPTITDNVIRDAPVAIWLHDTTVDLAAGVARNRGAGSDLDAIFLERVTTTTPWTWTTPTNSGVLHPLGHVVFRGDVTIAPGSSLTVPPGAVVPAQGAGIVVNGHFSAGAGSRFTALCDGDSSVTLNSPCFPTGVRQWSGVTLRTAGDAVPPTAVFTDAVLRDASTAVTVDESVPHDAAALRFTGGRVSNSNTAFALRGGANQVTGVTVAPAPGSGDTGTTEAAITVGIGASLTADRIEVASSGDYAISTAGSLTLTCANLHHNRGGVQVWGGPASVHDSDLGGNAGAGHYDVAALTPTSATRNWWGQPGGPQPGQVTGPVDSSDPLAAPSDCAPGAPWVRPASANIAPPPPPPSPPAPLPEPTSGYWMLGQDGRVYAFGDAAWHGNADVRAFGSRAVDIDSRRDNAGYWVVDDAGHVFALGSARWLGNVGGLAAGERTTSIAGTLTGNGYFVFTDRGRAFPFGDAVPRGDMSGARLNGPVIDAAVTGAGDGYTMVAADGGVFAFNARYAGSMGGKPLNLPVVGMSGDPDNAGYWLVAADGGIFAFDAAFRGSMGGKPLNRPVVGMVPYGDGYLMVASDGGIFNFSSKPFRGSLGGNPPSVPITSVAPVR